MSRRERPTHAQRAREAMERAAAAHRQGRLDEAAQGFREAAQLEPGSARAHASLGLALSGLGRPAEARASFERAAAIEPGNAVVLNALGLARRALGDAAGALAALEAACRADPRSVAALNNLGTTLEAAGRHDDAVACFGRALAVEPDSAGTHNNLGAAHRRRGSLGPARACFARAVALDPKNAEACSNLAGVLRAQGELDAAAAMFRRAVDAGGQNPARIHSNYLLTLEYLPDATSDEVFREHVRWGERFAPRARAQTEHRNPRDPDRPLRVGYVSPDLRNHSVAFFVEPLLDGHDRAAIATYAYAEVAKPDETTERLRRKFAQWRDTAGLSDAQLAERIREDQIDVLVDLAGHTENARLGVFALKPAPVQVTYLGYPDTTGVAAVDYRLTDAVADPESSPTPAVEQLARLPGCFLCYAPPFEAPALAPPPSRERGYVTFGCFNTSAKVNERVLAAWARLLTEVPDARLLLKAAAFADDETREAFAARMAAAGIARERARVAGWEPARSHHLALYNEVDVALDTFPYNGTTTTCEALWMGVPVVTLAGERHAARVGASLLTTAGLGELVARSEDEYVALAARLARDADRRSALRETLREALLRGPLCDPAGFARGLEGLYRAMWRRWCGARAELRTDAGATDVPAADAVASPASSRVQTRDRRLGRVAELCALADTSSRLGQRELALAYAVEGLAAVTRGDGGEAPRALLATGAAPSTRGLLLRMCLAFVAPSSYFAREASRDWLLAWADAEPAEPEPFLRFGLLFGLLAAASGSALPAPARGALLHAQKAGRDGRAALALQLLSGAAKGTIEFVLQGERLRVPASIERLSTYVLLEQGDWYNPDLGLERALPRAGDVVLDASAGVGVFALGAARAVGAQGRVLALEPDGVNHAALASAVVEIGNLQLRPCGLAGSSGRGRAAPGRPAELAEIAIENASGARADVYVDLASLDDLVREHTLPRLDLVRLRARRDVGAVLAGGARTLAERSPLLMVEVEGDGASFAEVAAALAEHRYGAYLFCRVRGALVRASEYGEWPAAPGVVFAARDEHAARLAAIGLAG